MLAVGAAVFAIGCTSDAPDLTLPEPQAVQVPAGPGAAQPFAAPIGGGIVLSWTEPAAEGHALRFAAWDGTVWSEPRTVTSGRDWFVNWADFPSVVALDDGFWAAHWLQRSGPGTYAYDVVLTTSGDGGTTWSAPVRPHGDGTQTEHGFVSIFQHQDGAGVVWLDGRQYADGNEGGATNEMQLRFASLHHADTGAHAGTETVLDDRICDCCQTAVAAATQGPVVFYRDRSPNEIRDISVTRLADGAWTQPRPVHQDGWEINACPVNGPAADADGDNVVVAWYTGAAGAPRVQVAFSADGGANFTAPTVVDDGQPAGRVDVLFLGNGTALVVWLERSGEDAAIRGRVVAPDGSVGPSAVLASTTAGRAGGFPRMARHGSNVLLAWTEPGNPSHVRAVHLPFSQR
ncbi:MAG TPA: sialidase family protein [Longimicrobiales bacterium]|nr:sialidase family protein [Longimicrobiales bacterium]